MSPFHRARCSTILGSLADVGRCTVPAVDRRHLVENALLARRDALEALEPVLRVYEGWARGLLGEVEGANGLMLHRYSGKVSYLVCPGLEREAEPAVELRVKVTLPALAIEVFDTSRREVRPRLGVEPGLLRRAEG